ncbi:hypothetical protein [Nonomuraea dietziae]|uniref:hypothetical protein n=1 Tax=Nonomuraea dietziae TaxID=65515 RepID=UPI003387E7F6
MNDLDSGERNLRCSSPSAFSIDRSEAILLIAVFGGAAALASGSQWRTSLDRSGWASTAASVACLVAAHARTPSTSTGTSAPASRSRALSACTS